MISTTKKERSFMNRKLVPGLLALLLTACATAGDAPARPTPAGHLVLIGGGKKPDIVMRKFIELAGGENAPIVVIPTASEAEDTPQYYEDLFRKELGSTDVVVLPIREKADASRPDLIAAAARARGIFFGGGDQSRITRALLATPVLDAIREAYRNGAVIGGTSAGTACQSRHMITGEGDFTVIRAGSVELVEGLGFIEGIILDQHFIARQRSNRLMSVVLEHPDHLGVAVDEDTAAWFRPDGTFEVMGDRSVMVIDPVGQPVHTSTADDGKGLLGVHGMRTHILLPGEVFDTVKREVVPSR